MTVRRKIRGQSQRLNGEQPASQQQTINPEVADAVLAEDEVREYLEEWILDEEGRNGHDGWRTCGERRGVERVRAEWFFRLT